MGTRGTAGTQLLPTHLVGATGFEPATARPPAGKRRASIRPWASPSSPTFPSMDSLDSLDAAVGTKAVPRCPPKHSASHGRRNFERESAGECGCDVSRAGFATLVTASRTEDRGALVVLVGAPRRDHLLQQLQRGQAARGRVCVDDSVDVGVARPSSSVLDARDRRSAHAGALGQFGLGYPGPHTRGPECWARVVEQALGRHSQVTADCSRAFRGMGKTQTGARVSVRSTNGV